MNGATTGKPCARCHQHRRNQGLVLCEECFRIIAELTPEQRLDDYAERNIACPHCGAEAGEWCRSTTGLAPGQVHVKRRRAARTRASFSDNWIDRKVDSRPSTPIKNN